MIFTACMSCCLIVWGMVGERSPWITTNQESVALISVLTMVPALLTFLMSGPLVRSLCSVRKSIDAVLTGVVLEPVDVTCGSEVGGLASSFDQMVERLNSSMIRMNVLAYHDPLTGLPNRRVIQHILQVAMPREKTGSFNGSILFVDLDGFKRVNDTLGHEAGDELLLKASRRIVEKGLSRTMETLDHGTTPLGQLRDHPPTDVMLVRYAGDEFVAVLPDQTDPDDLLTIAGQILLSLSQPFDVSGYSVSISASIGIARTPDDTVIPEDLLTLADVAMYDAKRQGKGRAVLFRTELQETTVARSTLERELRTAIRDRQFFLEYQPKIGAKSGDLVGVEALVRWQHPSLGRVSPLEFVELAEQGGMMRELGDLVLRMALAQASAWAKAGTPIQIAANVSASQFADPDFVAKVASALRDAELPATLLELEVTESAAMGDFQVASEKLRALQNLGIRIAIDDFGVGFSNLNQLVNLPFDTLKIDRSLVSDIGKSEKSESVIIALLGVASALGYETVAEGIENQEQFEFLKRYHCTNLQGFMIGKPVSAARLIAWRLLNSRPESEAERPKMVSAA